MKLGLLASGKLGLKALLYLKQNYALIFVMTDKNSLDIIKFCQKNAISYHIGNPRNKSASDFFLAIDIDVLASINYLYLIEQNLINLPKIIAFNLHGSLLPKYRGRTPHVWAIINNETHTGITVHKINSGCDTGDIIDQIKIEIKPSDTGAVVLQKFEKAYIPLIEKTLQNICSNTLVLRKQEELYATYYGKRTPNDGKIDWNWQKERIHNWVRAQANPYPGSFTFFENLKITIDEISFTDFGFNCEDENGKILAVIDNKPIVKTPNGAISIEKTREAFSFKSSVILY